jgi:hypothetical protein
MTSVVPFKHIPRFIGLVSVVHCGFTLGPVFFFCKRHRTFLVIEIISVQCNTFYCCGLRAVAVHDFVHIQINFSSAYVMSSVCVISLYL